MDSYRVARKLAWLWQKRLGYTDNLERAQESTRYLETPPDGFSSSCTEGWYTISPPPLVLLLLLPTLRVGEEAEKRTTYLCLVILMESYVKRLNCCVSFSVCWLTETLYRIALDER